MDVEFTHHTIMAGLTLLIFGCFWAWAPFGMTGPLPMLVTLASSYLLFMDHLWFVAPTLMVAGLIRSPLVMQSWPLSALTGLLFGINLSVVAAGWFPVWTLLFGAAIMLYDAGESHQRVVEEPEHV